MRRLSILTILVLLAGCDLFNIPVGGSGGTPSVVSAVPADGAQNVALGAAVKATLTLPNGGASLTSVSDSSVTLTNTSTNQTVPATLRVENDAERLTLTPTNASGLENDTTYRFDVTTSVEDEDGQAFRAYSSTFKTVRDGVPAVLRSRPADGEINVPVTISIATDIFASDGVDGDTLDGNVTLTNLSNKQQIEGGVGTSGGGDTITFTPGGALAEGTEYQFDVTSEVQTIGGTAFIPYTSTFVTSGSGPGTTPQPPGDLALIPQPTAADQRHSSLTVLGSNLYASTIDGRILRYPIGGDGSLGAPVTLTTIKGSNGEDRFVVGFTFDPAATPENPIAWISSTAAAAFGNDGAPGKSIADPWSGKITRLSGPNLTTVQDVVVGLPRSAKDHLTNSIAFDPNENGVLYFLQGSNTAMGAPDSTWLYQPERVLAGAVLRLDTTLVGSGTLNVQTEEGGTYDPYASGAPLTIYASGTRNAYDLVWHTNGNLYVPANGSAAGGNVPRYNPLPGTCERRPDGGYTGVTLTDQNALSGYISAGSGNEPVDGWPVKETMNDYLFKIVEGGYYGTPNPKRCEWILFGGGVGTGGDDIIEAYPASVTPDPNYKGYAYNFGKNISPNGSIEYKGNAFPELQGKLLVTQYSGGDNIVALSFDGSGNVSGDKVPIVESGSFGDPLDITENPSTGFLYVSSYDELGNHPKGAGITLLRPE